MKDSRVKIRQDGSTTVFELNRWADLSNDLLDSLDWSEASSKAAFRVKEPAREGSLSALSGLSEKYIVRIGYTAMNPAPPPPSVARASAEWRTPADLEGLKSMTRKSIIEHFYEPWRERESPQFLGELESFLERGIALNASAQYFVEGRAAGLINLMANRDCHARPVDHIAWVWIDSRLTPVERADAHAQLLRWLAAATTGPIHAFVHVFNARSRRFFEKIGFAPACVHVSRRSPPP